MNIPEIPQKKLRRDFKLNPRLTKINQEKYKMGHYVTSCEVNFENSGFEVRASSLE